MQPATGDNGTRYQATVPDTLDLAEHGRLAINGMLGSLNPALDYECTFLNILDVHPAYMLHWSSMVSGVMPKYIEALPLLRQMSGSDQDQALQQGFMEAMLRNMAEDGLIYDRKDPRRPWNVGVGYGIKDWDEDYANMAGNGRAITGLLYWLQWTGDEVWRQRAKRTAERMLELAVTDGDLAAPFFEMYRKALPAMTNAARQRWNAAGGFLPETMPFDGPAELPVDLLDEYRDRFLAHPRGTAVSPRLRGRCLYDWHLDASTRTTDAAHAGYSWISHVASSGAELAVHAWWHYRCTGDRAWLQSHAYPFLRGVAEFYRSLARRGEDGLWHIHGTNAHEDFWGVTDGIMDLAAIRGTLPLAIRAAEILDADADLRGQWQTFLNDLAPYPLGADPRAKALTGGALADDAWAAGYRGVVDGSHNPEDVQLTPIFPFEDWTLETRDPAADVVARRTLALAPRHRRVLGGEKLNTAIRSPIAAVRAGLGEELPAILERYRAAFDSLPNGFSLFEGLTAHSIEHLGLLTMILQEALLQSVAPRPGEPEVITVFPAWPRPWDAEFRLLARGGFLVTAAIRGGEVQAVEIESRLGEECRVRNPWPGRGVEATDLKAGMPVGLESDPRFPDVMLLRTRAGDAYRLGLMANGGSRDGQRG